MNNSRKIKEQLGNQVFLENGCQNSVCLCRHQKTAATSMELADLNFRLCKAELEAKEASESLAKYREQATEHTDRLQQLQAERDAAVSEQQKTAASLTVSCDVYLET